MPLRRAQVQIQVVYPGVDLLVLASENQATAIRTFLTTKDALQLHHPSVNALERDAELLRQHAQAVLDSYSLPDTKDLVIYLAPCRPSAAVIRQGLAEHGIGAEWKGYFDSHPDCLRVFWASTDLRPLIPVVTHELGHHLRPANLDREYVEADTYRVTRRLLHEGLAENLVHAVHGTGALHHTAPSPQPVLDSLVEVLRLERAGALLDGKCAGDAFNLLDGNDLYAPGSELLRRSGLTLHEAARVSPADYLERIIPHVPNLPSSGQTDDPWSPWARR